MTRTETLHKLLRLGPLEPLHAKLICGWPNDTFQEVMQDAISLGLVRLRRGGNQHTTQLEAL